MNIDEIRRKRMEELQRRMNEGWRDEALHQQINDQIKEMEKVARILLDDKAYERLNNIKLINEELAINILALLYQLYAAGKIRGKINDKAFKELLNRVIPQKRETRIIRK